MCEVKKGSFWKFVMVLFVCERFIKIWPFRSESETKIRVHQCLVVIPNYKTIYLKYSEQFDMNWKRMCLSIKLHELYTST